MAQQNQLNLDAAAILKSYVMAQQQQAPNGSVASAPTTSLPPPPAQAPQAPNHAGAALQHLLVAAQQQRPESTPAPLPTIDPNTARLVTDALTNMATQKQQVGAPPPPTAPADPPPQPYQQNTSTYGSDSTSPPTAAPHPQNHHHQSLLASAHLLGSLNPSIAAALMTTALQQSAGVTNLTFPPPQGLPLDPKSGPEQPRSSNLRNVPATGPSSAAATTATAPFSLPASTTGSLSGQPPPLSILPAPPPGAILHHHRQPQQQRPPALNHSITEMQRWTLEQLESHAKELQENGYQLPQAAAILLADARRKEEKRQAKRIANRKSASTSRARKKAQIDQLMNENAQLRKLELILSYLPDPVIVISSSCVITFCSMQWERVFKHKVCDLVGANIEELMIPKSRGVVKKLIRDLLAAEQELSDPSENGDVHGKKRAGRSGGSGGGHMSGNSEQSESAFPLLEVKVNSTQVDAGEDVSDSDENRRHSPNGKKSSQVVAAATEMSSLTHKDSSFNSNEGDDSTPTLKKDKMDTSGKKANSSESDESSDQRNANANLSKNVEACKLNKEKNVDARSSHKDDVTGAYVTANNADAKLSSLIHKPSLGNKHAAGKQEEQCSSTLDSSLSKTSSEKVQAKKGNSSEDSGYREGGESPEDSNSSSSSASLAIASLTRKRARPMAPSRNVCMIRSDLSTIWCEMTSSVRTSLPRDDAERGSVSKEDCVQEPEELQKEILLCFRPIQEGEKVSSDLRFKRVVSQEKQSDGSGSGSNPKIPGVSESSGGGSGSNREGDNMAYANGADPSSTETQRDTDGRLHSKKNKPLKKRPFEIHETVEEGNKKSRPAETSALEGYMME